MTNEQSEQYMFFKANGSNEMFIGADAEQHETSVEIMEALLCWTACQVNMNRVYVM